MLFLLCLEVRRGSLFIGEETWQSGAPPLPSRKRFTLFLLPWMTHGVEPTFPALKSWARQLETVLIPHLSSGATCPRPHCGRSHERACARVRWAACRGNPSRSDAWPRAAVSRATRLATTVKLPHRTRACCMLRWWCGPD
jgi:hypothetical protein